jgi:ubiquinone/menaquinone biosynthesis C-methylase UbiE
MMVIIDKNNILKQLDDSSKFKIEIGCGKRKKYDDFLGIDIIDHDCVDIIGDALEVIKLFPDNSVTYMYMSHFLEHVTDIGTYINEFSRVILPGGTLEIVSPHFSNPYYYSDSTHKTFFGLYTLSAFARDNIHSRKVPNYDNKTFFYLKRVDLVFKSSKPFYFRHTFKLLLGLIFNSCKYMRELYEETFSFLIPCYEIKYLLIKNENITAKSI